MGHEPPGQGGGGGGDDGGGGGGDTITNPAFVYAQLHGKGKPGDDLYLTTSDGSATVALTDTDGSFRHRSPKWSPDGSKLAFLRERQLYTINPDGNGLVLVHDFDQSGLPAPNPFAWSPDGTHLVYMANADGDGLNDLLALEMATGSISVLIEDLQAVGDGFPLEQAYDATWSPDLDSATAGYQGKILFTGWDGVTTGDSDIYVLDVVINSGAIQTGDVHVLIDDPLGQESPAWSPAGNAIVFKERDDTVGYIVKKAAIEASGTGLDVNVAITGNEILLNPANFNDLIHLNNSALTWSPDSQWIGFSGERPAKPGGILDIFRIRADGSDLTNVTTTDKANALFPDWNPAWSNDISSTLLASAAYDVETLTAATGTSTFVVETNEAERTEKKVEEALIAFVGRFDDGEDPLMTALSSAEATETPPVFVFAHNAREFSCSDNLFSNFNTVLADDLLGI